MKTELKKILYVEDDEDTRTIAQIALQEIGGFVVKICRTGEEALAAVEAFKPDLILLDVMMPGLDGPTTLRQLRKLPTIKPIPVMFVTARAQEDLAGQYNAFGVVGVIEKPFSPMTLAETLLEHWSRIE